MGEREREYRKKYKRKGSKGRPQSREWAIGYIMLGSTSGVPQAAVVTRIRGRLRDRYNVHMWFFCVQKGDWRPTPYTREHYTVDQYAAIAKIILKDRKSEPSEDHQDVKLAALKREGKLPPPTKKFVAPYKLKKPLSINDPWLVSQQPKKKPERDQTDVALVRKERPRKETPVDWEPDEKREPEVLEEEVVDE
jgi:hypothetical protein